jgi:nitric oxide reductase activation protein
MKRFEDEKESHNKIETQIRQRGDQKAKEIGKEFDDSFESGLELVIPKRGYILPFSRNEADSTAKMIADELKNKIVIGKTTVTKQVSGKIHLKSAVRSFVKYDVDGEFDEHIYKRDIIETPEHSVIMLIDCSSSMSASNRYANKSNLSYAKEVLYIIAKIFEELSVKFSIRGFQTGVDFLVKNWSDEFEWERLCGINANASTPTAEATDIAKKRMNDVDDELKIVFTITDGEPDDQVNTKDRVDECRKNGTQVFGIFYGADESSYQRQKDGLNFVYGEGNFIMAKDYEKLKEGLVKLYEKVLTKSSYGMNGG